MRNHLNFLPLKQNLLRIPAILFFSFVLIFFLFSCKKDPYKVGLDLLPPGDTLNVKTIDTCTVIAYSVFQDSVRSDETSLNIIGSLMDPVFGSTTSGVYMQYRLSVEAPDFGINPGLDSLVLMIPYGTIYGDTNALQTLRIYEMSESINPDSVYYSNHRVATYGVPIATYTYKPDRYDSLTIGGVKTGPHIRINLTKITNYLGNKILHAPTSDLSTNDNFLLFMKGLYIESVPVASGGALMSFNPTSTESKMVLYFHNESTGDSISYSIVASSSSARFNHFDHNNYIDADPGITQQVVHHDTTLGKDALYVQGLGGIRVRLRIPFLKDLVKSGKIAINSAILSFKNAQTDTTLQPPVKLNLLLVDTAGKLSFLTDLNEGTVYFNGYYSTTARTYEFRITRQVQQIIDGKVTNEDMYLMANNPSTNALITDRVMLTGTRPQLPAFSADRIRLKLVYTKLH